ncbi:MAG: 4Fe-4S dicluster domain-containing protein [Lachnospiraceae bacterium]|nr:4Fe-4S dicluster domain-containing protein [Lachnospiraceae bacterium]
MVTNDQGILQFKHKIIEEVARAAWEGELTEEVREAIVMKMIPGPQAQYRCCIYKERELARQRIRLAMGLCPTPDIESDNVIQVLTPACEECPISSYTVTDNCRLCMGKACYSSCRFGAISVRHDRTHIDPVKCKECGMCAQACPYGAIAHLERPCKKVCPVDAMTYDEYGICKIDESKCIQCGHCIHACPFGAISSKSYLVGVIRAIQSGKKVIAMCAPATEGQFGQDITMASVREGLLELGFDDMIEVGLGGDMTAAYESKEWEEAYKTGKKMTTSCCPAFINMLKNQYPDLYENNKSNTVSPMVAVSRLLKYMYPGCVTVFIGPCIAKKAESQDKSIPDNADFVMTYGEFRALMRSKGVELKPVDESYQKASIYGKRFANSGGVAGAVIKCMQERGLNTHDIKLKQCAGATECKTALQMLKLGRLEEDFVEGMMCPGGCVGGPSKHKTEKEITTARKKLLDMADGRSVLGNLSGYPMGKFSMYRDGHIDENESFENESKIMTLTESDLAGK